MDPLLIAILCFVLAGVLAAIDLFVPSGGVLAIASLLSGIGSIFFAFRSGPAAGMFTLILLLVAIPVFLVVAIRIWPYTPIGKRIILTTPQLPPATNSATTALDELVGTVGMTQGPLMPYGYVRILGRNYNAVALGSVIEANEKVQVLRIQQRNLVVEVTTLPLSQAVAAKPESLPTPGEGLLDMPAEDLGLESID